MQKDLLIGGYSNNLIRYKSKQNKMQNILPILNPSYVLNFQTYIYVVSEQDYYGTVDVLNPQLQILKKVQTKGNSPCHINVDKDGKYLVVTNYNSSSFIIWNLKNYQPTTIHSFMVHTGSSINPDRQSAPHPHSSAFSEANDVLFISDLGTDIIYYYEIDPLKITWRKQKSIKLIGAGPRTLCRGKAGQKSLYLSCELDNTVRILSYATNTLQQLKFCKISQNVLNFPSEVRLFSNQVYVANRGDDTISVLTETQKDLKVVNSFPVKSYPRHFNITPEGQIIVACQKGNVVLFLGPNMILLKQLPVEAPTIIAFL